MDLRRIDLNSLVALEALLSERSVTRAGQRLGIRQPAASAVLAKMRKLFDDQLLVKGRRGMELTPFAAELVDPLRKVLKAIDELVSTPETFEPRSSLRQFTLVASDYVGIVFCRPLAARLRELAPGIRLHVCGLTGRHAEMLRSGEADLAVLPSGVMEGPRDFGQEALFTDDVVAAVWSGNTEVGDRLSREQMDDLPYLEWQPDGDPASLVELDLDRHGVTRRVEASSSSLVAALFLLDGTRRYTLTPRRLPAAVLPDGHPVRVVGPGVPLRELEQHMYWPERMTLDAGHAWLRGQARAVAAEV